MSFIKRWQLRRDERQARRDRSEWDNPLTGADLLAAMVVRQKARKRRLP